MSLSKLLSATRRRMYSRTLERVQVGVLPLGIAALSLFVTACSPDEVDTSAASSEVTVASPSSTSSSTTTSAFEEPQIVLTSLEATVTTVRDPRPMS